ncbi:MAG: metal-dependent hydrolase [Bacteroidales bacterium]|jgi:inner membrane protein|nr:metal-dependent hydrolase [Bacteroidales bacterium]
MDLLSYMLLGAIVGGFVAARKIGNRALILGAIIAALPSLDDLINRIALTRSGVFYNSTFFHSLFFILIASPLVAWLLAKISPHSPYSLAQRCMLVFWVLIAHLALDVFSISGVSLFAPFSAQRIAVASIAPIDVLLYLLLFIGIVITLVVKQLKIKTMVLWCALFFTSLYVAFSLINKLYIKTEFQHMLQAQEIPHSRIGVFPVSGSNFKWNCLAQDHEVYWQLYLSNISGNSADFTFFMQNNHLFDDIADTTLLLSLKNATNNFYTIQQWGTAPNDSENDCEETDATILVHDLRYVRKNSELQTFFARSFEICIQNAHIHSIQLIKNNTILQKKQPTP